MLSSTTMATMLRTIVWIALTFLIATITAQNTTSRILSAAAADNIDLYSLNITDDALASIQAIYNLNNVTIPPAVSNGNKVDVHVHVVPPWYRILVPSVAQTQTPNWTVEAHLDFMAGAGIRRAVVSIGAPGSVVFVGDETKSRALARLLNEFLAALAYKFPTVFSFFAVIPLPYTDTAITESTHALTNLNASGLGLQSNHEAHYLGTATFTPFFTHLNALPSPPPIFVHPAVPCLHTSNDTLIPANPTPYPTSIIEFYFETARTFMDLTLTQTLVNLTSLKWIVPHGGGAFASVLDRFLVTRSVELQERSRRVLEERFWWDVAGPVFPRQVLGLLAQGVGVGRLLYGSDFPYAPNITFEYEIEAIENASFLTEEEKVGVFEGNSRAVLG